MSQTQSTEPLLIADSLSCIRGERKLFDKLSFSLRESQCLHLVGANGSGKTSLLRIIAGINHADTGSLNWLGESTRESVRFIQQLAYVGHLDGLKNQLTAAENLAAYQRLNGVFSESKVDQDLAKMGILRCADLTANKLSFGQRRRLAFARLLSGNYKLWVLDEPFTGIDTEGRALIEGICLDHLLHQGLIILTNHQDLSGSALANHLMVLQLKRFSGE